jgi:hypothetical protein
MSMNKNNGFKEVVSSLIITTGLLSQYRLRAIQNACLNGAVSGRKRGALSRKVAMWYAMPKLHVRKETRVDRNADS